MKAVKLTFTNIGFIVVSLSYALFVFGLTIGIGIGFFVNIYYVFGGIDNDKAATVAAIAGMLTVPASIVGSIFWGWIRLTGRF